MHSGARSSFCESLITDRTRGPLNVGGLYGERNGWNLPGYPAPEWADVSVPNEDTRPGVAWYRTTFRLDVPDGTDASLGLTVADDAMSAWRLSARLGEAITGAQR